jgi:hypothetical protein
VQRPGGGLRIPSSIQSDELRAIVEAEVGSLFELLPVPLLVTSETGDVLRANAAAGVFMDSRETLVGKRIDELIGGQAISVQMRLLCGERHARRLYVLQHAPQPALFSKH